MTNGFTILLSSCVTLPLPSTHRTKTQTGITCEKILLEESMGFTMLLK